MLTDNHRLAPAERGKLEKVPRFAVSDRIFDVQTECFGSSQGVPTQSRVAAE